ncbi:MAG: ankyrin repeat domain-containing protein [Betaproteobacteria bacterium]|nr:ankyrin repeat domain-containing protein [Betaproteobacteria bacterium]
MTLSLEEILQSTSDVLFPAELGEAPVTIDSRDCDGDTPLHVMAWRRDVGSARVLLAAGAIVNAIGDMGSTPLHVAIAQEDTAMIELLLEARATVTNTSEFGSTELQDAERKGGAVWKLVKQAWKNGV